MNWECPSCGGVPMWKDGAKSYCAKCNKVYNVETGEAKRADLKANTCKDVTLDIQG